MAHYQKPPAIIAKVANPLMTFAVQKLAIRPGGMAILAVRGRKTGRINKIPVNPVQVNGETYLVAPRGSTQWVRNIRVAGGGELSLGRKKEPITVTEVGDDEKLPMLREYISRFYPAVKGYIHVPRDASDEQLKAIAANHPVFRINR